jgi:hypothetical protein
MSFSINAFAQAPKGLKHNTLIIDQSKWISYMPMQEQAVDPNQLLEDRNALLKALESNQQPFPIDKINPAALGDIARLMLEGKKPLDSVALLQRAMQLYPQDLQLFHTYIRILIHLEQPSAARLLLKQRLFDTQKATSYSHYLNALALYIEASNQRGFLEQAKSEIEWILKNDPNYIGEDGIDSNQLKAFVDDINQRLK